MPDRAARLRRSLGTVRFRITALATAVVLVVLVACGAGLVVAQHKLLVDNLDEALIQGAATIEAALADGPVPLVLAGFGDDDAVAQVVDADGEVVAASANATGRAPIAQAPRPGDPSRVRTVDDVADDDRYRLLSVAAQGGDGPTTIHVAATLEDIDESRAALAAVLAAGIPVVVVVLALLIWILVGRTLRPVEAIRAEVADISGAGLDRRVPEPTGDDEIGRLARTMNAMLDRVEDSANRQQRFVADASHELRSPLTRMRAELEVDLAHPERSDLLATHRSVLDETTGLQALVDDLLHLARSDAGAHTIRRDSVDLDDVVAESARSVRAAGRVAVDTSGVQAVQVEGDAVALARAVANLADNAARHATSRVSFTVAPVDGRAVVIVADDGPGIPPDERARVFERFTRLDAARQGVTGGTGLGLAIARDIATRHGGTLEVDPAHSPGARFVLTLPLGA